MHHQPSQSPSLLVLGIDRPAELSFYFSYLYPVDRYLKAEVTVEVLHIHIWQLRTRTDQASFLCARIPRRLVWPSFSVVLLTVSTSRFLSNIETALLLNNSTEKFNKPGLMVHEAEGLQVQVQTRQISNLDPLKIKCFRKGLGVGLIPSTREKKSQ